MMGVFESAPARVRETSADLIRARAAEKAILKAKAAERGFERAQTFQAIVSGGAIVGHGSGGIGLLRAA
jgi:hypothetical protein